MRPKLSPPLAVLALAHMSFASFALSACRGAEAPQGARTESRLAAERVQHAPSAAPAAPVAAAPAAPNAQGDAGTDACHFDEELAAAFRKMAPSAPEPEWIRDGRSRLWSRVDAERALGGIVLAVVSAIAHKRYDKVAGLTSPDGLCLRAEKGAPCRTLSVRELSACAHSSKRFAWGSGTGSEQPPEYTCSEAFRRIFYARDFLRTGETHYNCFPDPGGAPVVLSGPAHGYVELRDPGSERERPESLWLVFDGEKDSPVLVELIRESSGS